VKAGQTYALRMALATAGYVPIPCRDGKPVLVLQDMPSEGFIRSWAITHPDADQTGVWNRLHRSVEIVDRVPETAAERERAANQQRKEAKRRAAGALPRAEWLAAHSKPPWEGSGMSRASFYRARKREKGAAGGGGTGQ
jgi:hypothetical protein